MNQCIVRAVLLAFIVASVYAIEDTQDGASSATEDRRIRKHRLPYYASLFGLGGLGGLNALAVLFAVKFKLLIVAAVVGLTVYYFSHTHSHSCGESIIPYSAYSDHGPTAYSASPSFISDHPHNGGIEYASYPGPDPYSAYSDVHPGQSASSGPAGYPSYSSSYGHNDRSSSASAAYDSTGVKSTSSRKKSAGRVRRQAPADFDALSLLNSINWGEIAFQFLGVDTMGCRKRFVCEFDFRAARNPFTRMAYTLIGKNFFDEYRDLSADSVKPAKFGDCARMYRECAAAEEYNDKDDAELQDVQAMKPTTMIVDDVLNNEVVEYDSDSSKQQAEIGRSMQLSEDSAGVHDVGRIIMLRAEQ